jgi:hypothetical protein
VGLVAEFHGRSLTELTRVVGRHDHHENKRP